MRGDRDRLLDILDAIEKIESRVPEVRAAFDDDEMAQVWALYHVQIIGEAASRLSATVRDKYPHIPWADIVSMRNVVVHHYFGIDLNEVWDAIHNDIPRLKAWASQMLADIN